MKLTFSTLACPMWSLPQIVGAAAAHGFHGFDPRGIGTEIDVTRLSRFTTDLDNTLLLLREHRLEIPCLNTSIALVTPAPDRWKMMLDECTRYAQLAGRAGSNYLRIFGGSVLRGMTRGEALAMAHRHLRQLVKVCDGHRCQVLLETHDDWSRSADMMELLGEFQPQEAGVLWDIEHPYRRGEDPQATAQALRDYIRHIHFKDSRLIHGRYVPMLVGKGELPLPRMTEALKSINYDRWICLETEKRWHPEVAPEPEESLPQFVKYMQEHWR